jgi:hypothetical protein
MQTNISNSKDKWEFEKTIENVFLCVEAYWTRTENFFKEVVEKDMKLTREKYCSNESVYIFKGDYHNKMGNKMFYPLYMTRLLTTHIRYLDDFRVYINKYYGDKIEKTLNKITDEGLRANFKNKENINSFVLSYIEKYIELLDKIEDPAKGDIAVKLKEQLEAVKRNPKLSVDIEELPYDMDNEDDNEPKLLNITAE